MVTYVPKNPNILIDLDWQQEPIDPNIFLEELQVAKNSSASNLSQVVQAGLLESIIRTYLKTKPFKWHKGVRYIENVYEFEEVFSLKEKITCSDFLSLLNIGFFTRIFQLWYSDQMTSTFENKDLMMIEVKESLSLTKWQTVWLKRKNKVQEFLSMLGDFKFNNPKEYKQLGLPAFDTIIMVVFFNGEMTKPLKAPQKSVTLYFEKQPITFKYICIFCEQSKIFFNFFGQEEMKVNDILQRHFELKEKLSEVESLKEKLSEVESSKEKLKKSFNSEVESLKKSQLRKTKILYAFKFIFCKYFLEICF